MQGNQSECGHPRRRECGFPSATDLERWIPSQSTAARSVKSPTQGCCERREAGGEAALTQRQSQLQGQKYTQAVASGGVHTQARYTSSAKSLWCKGLRLQTHEQVFPRDVTASRQECSLVQSSQRYASYDSGLLPRNVSPRNEFAG